MRTITVQLLLACYEEIQKTVGKDTAMKMIISTIDAGVVQVQGSKSQGRFLVKTNLGQRQVPEQRR
jgi:hypothetical protein